MVTQERAAPVGQRVAASWFRFSFENVLLLVTAAIVCGLVLYPLAILFLSTFRVDVFGKESYYTLENFDFLVSPRILRSIGNTLVVATGGTVVAGVFGIGLAWINARTNSPGRRILEPFNLIPYFMSPYVGAIAWLNLAAPRVGLLNTFLGNYLGLGYETLTIYNYLGIIWVLGVFFTPVMYLFSIGPLRRMDASLEESARMCGCGLWDTVRKVTLPLALPGILSGAIIVFVSSAGEFGVPLALGHPVGLETVTTQIFALTVDLPAKLNRAAAVAIVLAVLALVFIYIQRRIILPRDFVTVTGKSGQPRLIQLGGLRYLTLGFNLFYLAVAVVLPIFALTMASIARTWTGEIKPWTWTLDHYGYALANNLAQNGIKNSFVLAVGGATLSVVIGTIVAYAIYRTKARGRGFLDFISTIPIGVPGIVMAIGILMAYVATPLYATLWILLIGYVTRWMPFGQRNVGAVLLSLSPDLEQSARVAGASWLTMMRRILIPLLWPGIISAWTLLFVIFLREFPISILLYGPGTQVFSVAIWSFVENERAHRAAALAMLQVIALLAAVGVFRAATREDLAP